jgi:hypothetical protein
MLETHQVGEEENDQSGTQQPVAQTKYLRPLLQKYISAAAGGGGRGGGVKKVNAHGARSPPQKQSSGGKGRKGSEGSAWKSEDGDDAAPPLPPDFFERHQPLLINVGGYLHKDGWVNVNSQVSCRGSHADFSPLSG